MENEEKFIERLHLRVDETHKLINETKIDYAETKQVIMALNNKMDKFCEKVDNCIFHPDDGHIVKTRTKLSAICAQLKNQWYLITLLFGGMMGIVWMVIAGK